MTDASRVQPGIGETVRQLGRSLLGLLQARIALIGVELQEEKIRALRLFLWLGIAFASGAIGSAVAVGTVALVAWQRAGYAGLAGLSALCLLGAVFIVQRLYRTIATSPLPFAATTEEFRKDLECLQSK